MAGNNAAGGGGVDLTEALLRSKARSFDLDAIFSVNLSRLSTFNEPLAGDNNAMRTGFTNRIYVAAERQQAESLMLMALRKRSFSESVALAHYMGTLCVVFCWTLLQICASCIPASHNVLPCGS